MPRYILARSISGGVVGLAYFFFFGDLPTKEYLLGLLVLCIVWPWFIAPVIFPDE